MEHKTGSNIRRTQEQLGLNWVSAERTESGITCGYYFTTKDAIETARQYGKNVPDEIIRISEILDIPVSATFKPTNEGYARMDSYYARKLKEDGLYVQEATILLMWLMNLMYEIHMYLNETNYYDQIAKEQK